MCICTTDVLINWRDKSKVERVFYNEAHTNSDESVMVSGCFTASGPGVRFKKQVRQPRVKVLPPSLLNLLSDMDPWTIVITDRTMNSVLLS